MKQKKIISIQNNEKGDILNMKKFVSLLLIITMTFSLFGCSNFFNNKTYKIPKSISVTRDGMTETYIREWNFENNTITENYSSGNSKSDTSNVSVTDFSLSDNGLITRIGSMLFIYDNEGHLIEITDGKNKSTLNWTNNYTKVAFGDRTILFDDKGNPINAKGNNGFDDLWICYIDKYGNALKLRNYTKPITLFADEANIVYDENHNVISVTVVDDDNNSYQMKYQYDNGYCTQVELQGGIKAAIEYTDVTEKQYNAYKILKDIECPYMKNYVFNVEFDYVLWTKAN